MIEISFAVSQSSSKGLIASCLEMTTYQSLWSRHVIPKQIDQRNPGGNMPYFLDDGLYDFSMETYMYYTKVPIFFHDTNSTTHTAGPCLMYLRLP